MRLSTTAPSPFVGGQLRSDPLVSVEEIGKLSQPLIRKMGNPTAQSFTTPSAWSISPMVTL